MQEYLTFDIQDSLFCIMIEMIDWASQRQSLAENFAGRAQSASSYMLSSRASRRLREQGDQENNQIEQFKQEIEKRFLLSVANKFYSFPYSQLTFDNPYEEEQIRDLVGKRVYCLYQGQGQEQQLEDDSIDKSKQQSHRKKEQQSTAKMLLNMIKSDRQKCSQLLQVITSHRNPRVQQIVSKSKQKKTVFKYGVIREEDEQILRKRLYTEPYQKQAGFIVKKK